VGTYVLRRLAQVPVILLLVSAVVFFAVRLAPGDPIDIATETARDPAEKQRIRRAFGLDRPLWEQYVSFVSGAVRGEFGRSYFSNAPVVKQIEVRLPATLELALAAMGIGLVVGLSAGLVSSLRPGSWLDAVSQAISLTGVSIPPFVLGLVFITVFAVQLRWLPIGDRWDSGSSFDAYTGLYTLDSLLFGEWDHLGTALRHLALPAITLGLFVAAFIGRITRITVVEAMRQDFVRTARSKGLRESMVLLRHGLPNAMLPIVTVVGLQFGNLLGGAVIVESVFSWPGLGKLLVDAINVRDYPQVQASVLLLSCVYVLVNLLVDLLYGVLDPRVRFNY
jgi:peptide/nickel transport system permease protein